MGVQSAGDLTLSNCTVSDNTAVSHGGGIYASSGSVTMQNTILGGNSASYSPECWGSIGSAGYNLVGDNSNCGLLQPVGI